MNAGGRQHDSYARQMVQKSGYEITEAATRLFALYTDLTTNGTKSETI